MVDFEAKLSEPAFGAPLPKPRHERHAVKLIFDPSGHCLPIAPQGREPIPPIRARPNDGVKTAFNRTNLGQRPLQMLPELRIALLRKDELRNDEKRLRWLRRCGRVNADLFAHMISPESARHQPSARMTEIDHDGPVILDAKDRPSIHVIPRNATERTVQRIGATQEARSRSRRF
jgi:hypothetical protein